MPHVEIIIGSESDRPKLEKVASHLTKCGISYKVSVLSAHHNPDELANSCREGIQNNTYEENRCGTLSAEVVEEHRGQWLAVSADGCRIVASAQTFDEVMERVKSTGHSSKDIHVMRVPENDEGMPLGSLELE